MIKNISAKVKNNLSNMLSNKFSNKFSNKENLLENIPVQPTKPNNIHTKSLLEEEDNKVRIVVNKTVRTKYKIGWINKIRKNPIVEIVIHGTAGGRTVQGLLYWMYNWGRPRYPEGIGLFHYAIGRGDKDEPDGLVVEILDPEYWVYHSTSSYNDYTSIGIELLNTSKSNRDPYTDKQYESLFSLIFDHLMVLYPSITRITSHRYNIWRWNSKKIAQKNDRNCPGNFDWSRLDKELKKRNYTFKIDGNLRYNIIKPFDDSNKTKPIEPDNITGMG